MTVKEELEMIANDCLDCAIEAVKLRGDVAEAEKRAWLSVAYRIRHAAKRL